MEPTSETACRFNWPIAIEPHPAARPANRLLLSTPFRDSAGTTACAEGSQHTERVMTFGPACRSARRAPSVLDGGTRSR